MAYAESTAAARPPAPHNLSGVDQVLSDIIKRAEILQGRALTSADALLGSSPAIGQNGIAKPVQTGHVGSLQDRLEWLSSILDSLSTELDRIGMAVS